MKALRTIGERQVEVVLDLPIPKPEPGEVVVEMKATGICGSDLHPYRRPTTWHLEGGFISGHEPCGVIAEVGKGVSGWKVGDNVVPYFRRGCMECRMCRTSRRHLCTNRRASYGHQGCDGSHAEFMRVEQQYLMPLPEYLTYEEGAILACQGGTAYAPLVRLGVSGRDVLVISGLGPVGLLSLVFAKPMGATIVGIDPSAGRRALAEKLGAAVVLDPAAGPIGEQLREHVPDGADKLTETSGATAAHGVMGDLLKPLGMAALVGGGTRELVMPLRHLTSKEIAVFGSSAYPPSEWETICEFVQRHDVKLGRVVSERFPLEEGVEAFRIAADANTGKVMFRC